MTLPVSPCEQQGMNSLEPAIRKLVEAFVLSLEAAVRKSALEAVAEVLGAPPSASRRAAPPQRRASTAPVRKARAALLGRSKPSARVRRSAAQIEAAGARIVAHVEKHPGARAEDIRAALSIPKSEWTLTIKRLVDTSRLVTKGVKRQTTYTVKAAPSR